MTAAADRRWFEAVASIECCVLCGQHGVQVAHSNRDRGMGQKSAAHLNHEIDNGKNLAREERRAQMDRAIVLTHDALIRAGRLVLK